MPGNAYDSRTLAETLEPVGILADAQPKITIVDKGYRGVDIDGVRIVEQTVSPRRASSLPTYVFRRDPTAGWLCLIDNSYGTELLDAPT